MLIERVIDSLDGQQKEAWVVKKPAVNTLGGYEPAATFVSQELLAVLTIAGEITPKHAAGPATEALLVRGGAATYIDRGGR